MTVAQTQRAVTSAEFAEWIAFYVIEAEERQAASGEEPEPTQSQLGDKISSWAAMQNARAAAKG